MLSDSGSGSSRYNAISRRLSGQKKKKPKPFSMGAKVGGQFGRRY